MKNKIFAASAFMLFTAACASNINSNHYATSSTGTVGQAVACTVVSVRQVNVSSSDSSTGAVLGAIGGGVAGSTIGHGRGSLLGALGGAALGGLAGDFAQEGLSKQAGVEYIVRLDNGAMRTITQGTDVYMQPGQKSYLLYGDQSRVIPAN